MYVRTSGLGFPWLFAAAVVGVVGQIVAANIARKGAKEAAETVAQSRERSTQEIVQAVREALPRLAVIGGASIVLAVALMPRRE